MSKKVLKALTKRFKKEIVDSHDHVGDETILILPEHLLEIAQFLREDPKMSFEVLSDVTAMDYLRRKPRFEVVYHFHSLTLKHRSEEHTSELQSRGHLVCRLLLEKK